MKPIALSFKNNKEDIELYKWIASHSNMSGFIKDTLRLVKENDMLKNENKKCGIKNEVNKTELIDIDF